MADLRVPDHAGEFRQPGELVDCLCDSCAVVVNRRFTGAAQDFAQRNGCAAIGAGEFPDFVLGKIEW